MEKLNWNEAHHLLNHGTVKICSYLAIVPLYLTLCVVLLSFLSVSSLYPSGALL